MANGGSIVKVIVKLTTLKNIICFAIMLKPGALDEVLEFNKLKEYESLLFICHPERVLVFLPENFSKEYKRHENFSFFM